MNIKKLGILAVVAFVSIFVTDFVIHGVILKSTYQATPQLWRPEAEMGQFFPFMLLGQVLAATFFAWIFLHGYKGNGAIEGVRYGLLMCGVYAGNNLVMYAVVPYGLGMVLAWIGLAAVQFMIVGSLCALVADKLDR